MKYDLPENFHWSVRDEFRMLSSVLEAILHIARSVSLFLGIYTGSHPSVKAFNPSRLDESRQTTDFKKEVD